MSEYKMIVLDLDGTLTNRNKEITPKTKETLMKAQEQGKIVVLASGRPTYGVMPLAEELHLEDYGGYILSFNGGIIMNCKTKEVVFSRQIPAESNGKIIDLAQEHNVSILTYENRTLLTNRPEDQYVQLESRINTLKIIPMTIEELKAHVTFSVPKFLMTDDGDYLAMVEPKVKAALGKNFSVYRSDPFFLEILPKGIDKAQSLERLLAVIGVKREEMIACPLHTGRWHTLYHHAA